MGPRVYVLVDETDLELLGPASLLGDEWPLARVEAGGRFVLPFYRDDPALAPLEGVEIVDSVELVEVQMESFP